MAQSRDISNVHAPHCTSTSPPSRLLGKLTVSVAQIQLSSTYLNNHLTVFDSFAYLQLCASTRTRPVSGNARLPVSCQPVFLWSRLEPCSLNNDLAHPQHRSERCLYQFRLNHIPILLPSRFWRSACTPPERGADALAYF